MLKPLAVFSLAALASAVAHAALTLTPDFTTADTTDFPGSIAMSKAPNASTIEASIDAAIAQIDKIVANPLTFTINFVDDPNTSLGASVDSGNTDISFTNYRTYLNAETNKSAVQTVAFASLPTGQSTNIDLKSTQVNLGGPILEAIGDTSAGKSLISGNGGFAGTIALNLSDMNISRSSNNPNNYDIEAVVMHELDEVLGMGGQGSTLGSTPVAKDVGPMDLYRYYGLSLRSYNDSSKVVSYFSINGGTTDLVHFNQSSDGDYGDWGNGTTPAQDEGNTPPQVQDAFGTPGTQTNIGEDEAVALNAIGWQLTTAGVTLEGAAAGSAPGISHENTAAVTPLSVPEPADWISVLLGGLALAGMHRLRRKANVPRCPAR